MHDEGLLELERAVIAELVDVTSPERMTLHLAAATRYLGTAAQRLNAFYDTTDEIDGISQECNAWRRHTDGDVAMGELRRLSAAVAHYCAMNFVMMERRDDDKDREIGAVLVQRSIAYVLLNYKFLRLHHHILKDIGYSTLFRMIDLFDGFARHARAGRDDASAFTERGFAYPEYDGESIYDLLAQRAERIDREIKEIRAGEGVAPAVPERN